MYAQYQHADRKQQGCYGVRVRTRGWRVYSSNNDHNSLRWLATLGHGNQCLSTAFAAAWALGALAHPWPASILRWLMDFDRRGGGHSILMCILAYSCGALRHGGAAAAARSRGMGVQCYCRGASRLHDGVKGRRTRTDRL